jgi:4-hydroxybutyrate CoA-transferase
VQLGVSVDIVKAAAANAKYVIAQVNSHMPRTYGDSFIHVNHIDMLVPRDEPIIESITPQLDDRLRKTRGKTSPGSSKTAARSRSASASIPQAVAEFLHDKKDLGVHTEMFSDWIIDWSNAARSRARRRQSTAASIVTASFCMGSQKLYDYIDNNPVLRVPADRVRERSVYVIAQHERWWRSTWAWRST